MLRAGTLVDSAEDSESAKEFQCAHSGRGAPRGEASFGDDVATGTSTSLCAHGGVDSSNEGTSSGGEMANESNSCRNSSPSSGVVITELLQIRAAPPCTTQCCTI